MPKIQLSASFLMEASPVFDDAEAAVERGSTDTYLLRMAPVVAKIRAQKNRDKWGYATIDVTPEEAQVLVEEGTYRAQECRERAADAWDNRERMAMLGSASGCAGVAKRAQAIVDKAS